MKEGWTIGSRTSIVAGHGMNFYYVGIQTEGDYYSGDLPPVFLNKEKAEKYKTDKKIFGEVIPIRVDCEE